MPKPLGAGGTPGASAPVGRGGGSRTQNPDLRRQGVVRQRTRDESGFTLVEILVVALLLSFVLVATMGSLDSAQSQSSKDVEYAHAISDATSGLQTMMRELRNSYRINGTDGDATTGVGSTIDFFAHLNLSGIPDQDVEVEYSCAQPSLSNPTNASYHSCVRVWEPDGTALPAISSGCSGVANCAVVIDRVENPHAFTFIGATGSPNPVYPTYVKANVVVPAAGPLTSGLKHNITLNNGTALPNLQNGQ